MSVVAATDKNVDTDPGHVHTGNLLGCFTDVTAFFIITYCILYTCKCRWLYEISVAMAVFCNIGRNL
jgi:hypothetical protein